MLCPHCWIPKGFAVSLFWLPQECLMPTVPQGKIKGAEQQGIPQSCLIKEPGQLLKENWCQNLFLHVKKRVKVNQKGWKGDIEINKEIKVQVANILPKVFGSVFSFKVLFKKKKPKRWIYGVGEWKSHLSTFIFLLFCLKETLFICPGHQSTWLVISVLWIFCW